MDFNFVKLIFTLRLERNVTDRNALFSLRAVYSDVFRETAGCHRAQCGSCPEVAGCPWHSAFSQTLSQDPDAVRRFQKPPLPFVFDIPILPQAPNVGELAELGLILAGSAVNSIDFHMQTLLNLFRGAGSGLGIIDATVVSIESSDVSGNRSVLLSSPRTASLGSLSLISARDLQDGTLIPAGNLQLEFLTPLRLMQDGKLLRNLRFPHLIRSLFRRVSALAYYYSNVELDFDYKWLTRKSEEVETDASDLRWADWISGGGLAGSVSFSGDLTEFHFFILLGEYLHLGKGASYGLGRYSILRHNV